MSELMGEGESPAVEKTRVRRYQGVNRRRWRFSTRELLIALFVLIVVSPFVSGLPYGNEIEGIFITIVLLAAVLALRGPRRTFRIACLLVGPAIWAKWMNHLSPEFCPRWVFFVAMICFFTFVIGNLLGHVLTAPKVNGEVLCGGVSVYLLTGFLWAFMYGLVAVVTPEAFGNHVGTSGKGLSPSDAYYLSFVTLTTVGYGDIVPVSRVARMLVVLEAVSGMFYGTILVARLVSMYSKDARKANKHRD